MKHKPWNVFFHELIGLRTRILSYTDPKLIGISGVIVWETSRSLLLRLSNGRIMRILKGGALLELELPSGEKVAVEGYLIIGDPSSRARRIRRG